MIDNKESHESYGVLSFNRSYCSGKKRLFGSSIEHSDTIVMCLRRASKHRDVSHTWYYGEDEIARVEMSASQFADVITSLGCGDGIPVTLRYVDGKKMDDVPVDNMQKMFNDEFVGMINKAYEQTNEIISSVRKMLDEKKALGQKDKQELLSLLGQIKNNISNNLEHVNTQFQEHMDLTVQEAKAEVESHIVNTITSAGIKSINSGSEKQKLIEK